MADAFEKGVVLVMSLWDDHAADMLWLDSSYPTTDPTTKPGVARGSCSTSSGKPADVEKNSASSTVKFTNIKWGDIGSLAEWSRCRAGRSKLISGSASIWVCGGLMERGGW